MARLQEQYEETGIRRSVDAVMLVMVSILYIQVAPLMRKEPRDGPCPRPSSGQLLLQAVSSTVFPRDTIVAACPRFAACFDHFCLCCMKLHDWADLATSPGGYLDPTEDEISGLLTRLDEQLGVPIDTECGPNLYERPTEDWRVNDRLSMWWRPNFDTFLVSRRDTSTGISSRCAYLPPGHSCRRQCTR